MTPTQSHQGNLPINDIFERLNMEIHTFNLHSSPLNKQNPIQDSHKNPFRDNKNRKNRQNSYHATIKTLRVLERMFPACFNQKGPKPLKRKIEQDLFAVDEIMLTTSKTNLRNALSMYAHQSTYYQSVLQEEWRYDLAGRPVEKIDRKHKRHAQETLMKRQKHKSLT